MLRKIALLLIGFLLGATTSLQVDADTFNKCTQFGPSPSAGDILGCDDQNHALWVVPSGGSGVNIVPINSITKVTSGQTLFMSPGTGVSASEADVAMPVANTLTLNRLACTTSAPTGVGKNVDVVGRAGPCGGMIDVGAFDCLITGSNSVPGFCSTIIGDLLVVPSGQCFGLKPSTPSGMLNDVIVKCTLERLS